MRLPWGLAARSAFALLALFLLTGQPAGIMAETSHERGGKAGAAPGSRTTPKAPPSEHNQPPASPSEPVPEAAPGPGEDGCPFLERRLELLV